MVDILAKCASPQGGGGWEEWGWGGGWGAGGGGGLGRRGVGGRRGSEAVDGRGGHDSQCPGTQGLARGACGLLPEGRVCTSRCGRGDAHTTQYGRAGPRGQRGGCGRLGDFRPREPPGELDEAEHEVVGNRSYTGASTRSEVVFWGAAEATSQRFVRIHR